MHMSKFDGTMSKFDKTMLKFGETFLTERSVKKRFVKLQSVN